MKSGFPAIWKAELHWLCPHCFNQTEYSWLFIFRRGWDINQVHTRIIIYALGEVKIQLGQPEKQTWRSIALHRSTGDFLPPGSRADALQTIQALPGQIDIVAAKVTVGCGLLKDRFA